ncbi:hypothetical protein BC828DRAFT_372389 [Blastocladiella britannica]|nr:hypothetical protein BC828DRAFT_372389 [Blastocladiella britannica]
MNNLMRAIWTGVLVALISLVTSGATALTRPNVLVYVTPWNTEGYDRVLAHASLISHVSPTWHTVHPTLDITTVGDRNQTWLDALAMATSRPRLVPRYSFEGWTEPDLVAWIESPARQRAVARALVAHCQRFAYNGAVLEVAGAAAFAEVAVKAIRDVMVPMGQELIVVVPPAPLPTEGADALARPLTSAGITRLAAMDVSVSIMTYDFSLHRRTVGPNAPLPWVEHNLQHACPTGNCPTVLLGLHFFGMRAILGPGGRTVESFEPILGRDIPPSVKQGGDPTFVQQWDDGSAEKVLAKVAAGSDPAPKMLIWYPSRKSMEMRLAAVSRAGCGIAIWEAGQGTDELWETLATWIAAGDTDKDQRKDEL